jgi:hypothetical protein
MRYTTCASLLRCSKSATLQENDDEMTQSAFCKASCPFLPHHASQRHSMTCSCSPCEPCNSEVNIMKIDCSIRRSRDRSCDRRTCLQAAQHGCSIGTVPPKRYVREGNPVHLHALLMRSNGAGASMLFRLRCIRCSTGVSQFFDVLFHCHSPVAVAPVAPRLHVPVL